MTGFGTCLICEIGVELILISGRYKNNICSMLSQGPEKTTFIIASISYVIPTSHYRFITVAHWELSDEVHCHFNISYEFVDNIFWEVVPDF